MPAEESIWSTLHNITSIKRQELAKQRDACQAMRTELFDPVKGESDSRERLRLLLRGAGKRIASDKEDVGRPRKFRRASEMIRKRESAQHQEILELAGISASNLQRFLEQSENDASITSAFFSTLENQFLVALQALEVKYKYATLFSDLVTERSSQVLDATEYETVGRQEMQDQRKEWESLVFSPMPLDEAKILSTLTNVFSSPEALQSLDVLRSGVETLCHTMQEAKIQENDMKIIVDGLIASDLLSDEQTSVLKEVRNSKTWLVEMADVLNLRLQSIERWTWQTEAMSLEMRRQLNGKYRVFMQEEITQALLIYHVGITFASSFAQKLDKFYSSSGWKKHTSIGNVDQAKWDYFIGKRYVPKDSGSIRKASSLKYQRDYFMSTLPRYVYQGSGGYGDDVLDEDNKSNTVTKVVDAKHSLLHLITTESRMADSLNEEMIVLQTDFRWFGPSLSHSTITAVMKFLGVSSVWQEFFVQFLQAPMRFLQDGPNGLIRRRERGTPMSHILSTFFGEAVLFCLDFAVNEATNGKPMFRMHDDIWLWGTTEEMIAAWKVLTELSSVMGITINEEKTGAARLTEKDSLISTPLSSTLPKGSLHWGLLSVQQNGQFIIDQSKIDEHIIELRRQLASRKSILDYVKAYNSYMNFFALHFCKPANTLGRSHVDDCLRTLRRIHQELYPSTNGSAAEYVKMLIKQRFNVDDIPDGFVFFPLALGGLDLRNPFVSLQGMRETVVEEPFDILQEALEKEQVEYRLLQEIFDREGPADVRSLADRPTHFMSTKEYEIHRREKNEALYEAWQELMCTASEEMVEQSTEMKSLIAKIGRREGVNLRNPYWFAIVEMYGEEMKEVFGSLQVVERGLLPMGMVELFKSRVRWDA